MPTPVSTELVTPPLSTRQLWLWLSFLLILTTLTLHVYSMTQQPTPSQQLMRTVNTYRV